MTTYNGIDSDVAQKKRTQPIRRLALQGEVVLDPTIDFASVTASAPVGLAAAKSIFLTGGTGFLGVYLLRELLQQTDATIHCLVRSTDQTAGMARLHNKLAANQLWDEAFRARIVPVIGNLAQPRLGLSPQQFQELTEEVDVIVHNGAIVNFLQPYGALKAPNVAGTQEIIRLATQSKIKPLHYVSTVFVFGARPQVDGRAIQEEDELGDGAGLFIGYFQSKWVAEKILGLAQARGLPVSIYRPGVLIGDSQTGVWDNQDDFFCRVIKGCIQLGAWPALDAELFLTPVEYVSQALVHLARQPAPQKSIFHLVNSHPLHFQQLFKWIESFGYGLEQMPLKEWQTKLRAWARKPQDNALAVLAPLLAQRRASTDPLTLADMYEQRREPQFDSQNTLAVLAGTSINCPQLERAHFRRYIDYFVQSGFLVAPADFLAEP